MRAAQTPDGAALARLLEGRPLEPVAAEALMDAVMQGGVPPARLAALLTALRIVGVDAPVLAAFARAIRGHMVPVESEGVVLDTCGTGGSGLSTPNTSTLAAFVLASAGVRVAKHGNRASSGRCGSADLLEAVGVPLRLPASARARLLSDQGVVFLFAPDHHPAFRHVGPTRKALGFRTVFNVLGPLCNPAGARRQLLGVSDPGLAPVMAAALRALGSDRVLVVHGEDGLDEATLTAPTRFWRVDGDAVVEGRLTPESLGLERAAPADLEGGEVGDNVRIFESVLAGEGGPISDLVALNAGLALWVAGQAGDAASGVALAQRQLRSGDAGRTFAAYRDAARSLA